MQASQFRGGKNQVSRRKAPGGTPVPRSASPSIILGHGPHQPAMHRAHPIAGCVVDQVNLQGVTTPAMCQPPSLVAGQPGGRVALVGGFSASHNRGVRLAPRSQGGKSEMIRPLLRRWRRAGEPAAGAARARRNTRNAAARVPAMNQRRPGRGQDA